MRNYLFIFLLCMTSNLLANDAWSVFKEKTISEMSTIPGWCTVEKANVMMDLIKNNKLKRCIEIGVFSGRSLLPIAKALRYNKDGYVVAIDAWDPDEAVKGFLSNDANKVWWGQLDFDYFYNNTLELIKRLSLNDICTVLRRTSKEAASLFEDDTIDFIHFDGNHGEEQAFEDIKNYFSKVKDGGYILLNDPNWATLKLSLVFLLERTDLVSDFSPSATFFLFRKNYQKYQNAEHLFRK